MSTEDCLGFHSKYEQINNSILVYITLTNKSTSKSLLLIDLEFHLNASKIIANSASSSSHCLYQPVDMTEIFYVQRGIGILSNNIEICPQQLYQYIVKIHPHESTLQVLNTTSSTCTNIQVSDYQQYIEKLISSPFTVQWKEISTNISDILPIISQQIVVDTKQFVTYEVQWKYKLYQINDIHIEIIQYPKQIPLHFEFCISVKIINNSTISKKLSLISCSYGETNSNSVLTWLFPLSMYVAMQT